MPHSERREQIDIAILGAGISGLALAVGLLNRGITPAVYEAASEFSSVGAGIGLGPNALKAIDLLDPQLRRKYDTIKTGNQRPDFENAIFDALYGEEGCNFGERRGWKQGVVGAPNLTRSSAHRKDLLQIMESLMPPGVVRFNKRAEEIMQAGGKVMIRFSDGQTVLADALIGADGIKGATRGVVLGDIAPSQVSAKYCNMYTYRGIVPMDRCRLILGSHAGDAKWFMAKGRGMAVYPISKGREEEFVCFVTDSRPWDGSQEAEDVFHEEMMSDLGVFDGRLLTLLDWAKPFKWPVFHHPETQTYYNGRVCLIGDVAHASSPGQAAGVGQDLEDAVVLSHLLACVSSPDQLDAAFDTYDAIRRPRAQNVAQTSQEAGEMYAWNLPETGSDMQKIVDNANERFHWIWQHDIQADVDQAEIMFYNAFRRPSNDVPLQQHAPDVGIKKAPTMGTSRKMVTNAFSMASKAAAALGSVVP